MPTTDEEMSTEEANEIIEQWFNLETTQLLVDIIKEKEGEDIKLFRRVEGDIHLHNTLFPHFMLFMNPHFAYDAGKVIESTFSFNEEVKEP